MLRTSVLRPTHVARIPLILIALAPVAASSARAETAVSSADPGAPPSIAASVKPLRPDDVVHAKGHGLELDLARKLTDLWKSGYLRRGTTAIYVVDEATGRPIFAVHEDEPMNPASNTKLFSTGAALNILGPDWRYSTRLLGPAPDEHGICHGDVYLLGTGDPTLRAGHLDELVEQLVKLGVHEIEGDVVIGSNTIRDSVARSAVKVTITGVDPGKPASVSLSPDSDLFEVQVTARSVARKRGHARISLEWVDGATPEDLGHYVVNVSGSIRDGRTASVWRGVSRGATFTAFTLRSRMLAAGIHVGGGIRIEEIADMVTTAAGSDFLPIELARHESIPIGKLIARINKPSNNFLADRLLMTAGAAVEGGLPSMEKGIEVLKHWLDSAAGIDPSKLTVDTGSGLSYSTRITAQQIVHMLRMGGGLLHREGIIEESKAIARAFLDSLSVGGHDGTLRGRFKHLPDGAHVIGKTGTLTSVIALSGFVRDGDGPGLCFSILTNGNRHRLRNHVRHQHEELVEAMLGYLRARHAQGGAHSGVATRAD